MRPPTSPVFLGAALGGLLLSGKFVIKVVSPHGTITTASSRPGLDEPLDTCNEVSAGSGAINGESPVGDWRVCLADCDDNDSGKLQLATLSILAW